MTQGASIRPSVFSAATSAKEVDSKLLRERLSAIEPYTLNEEHSYFNIPEIEKIELREMHLWVPSIEVPAEGYVWAPYIPVSVTPTLLEPEEFVSPSIMNRYGKKIK